jgi:TolB-like protein/DNA-binding winged helix-turn-helix (wHTH) protein
MPLTSNPVRFGDFELDLRAGELRRNGTKVKLQEQPLQVLAMLLEHPGAVVTRDELKRELWTDHTFVDFEHGLNAAVKRLRVALGDSADHPHYIETLPRHGYRFMLSIEERPGIDEVRQQPPNPESPTSSPTTIPRWPFFVAAGLVLVLLSAASYFAWRSHRRVQTGARVTVAVLPLQNLSGDPGREFFTDGVTDEIINQLAHLDPSELAVIASTSIMPYKNTPKKINQIGSELGADYILEGSVREEGGRARITVQLIAVANQAHVWAESYERDTRDILPLQTEIALAVAQQIRLKLTPPRRGKAPSD